MKITIGKKALVECLKKVTCFTNNGLNDIVAIETDAQDVIVKAPTMNKLSKGGLFSANVDADIEVEGGVIVSAKKLHQIATHFKGDVISINYIEDDDNKYAQVTDGRTNFNLPLKKADFTMPDIDYFETIEVKAKDFKALIGRTSFASSKNYSSRDPFICTSFSVIDNERLQVIAVNFCQIAVSTCPCQVFDSTPLSFNAYTSEMKNFAAILPKTDDIVSIELGITDKYQNRLATFSFDNFQLTTLLFDGEFPQLAKPLNFKLPIARLNTKEFKNVLNQMSIVTKMDVEHKISFNFIDRDNPVLMMTAKATEGYGSAEINMECIELAKCANFSLNADYLTNAVNQLSEDEFYIFFANGYFQIMDKNLTYVLTIFKEKTQTISENNTKQIDSPPIRYIK